MNNINKSLFKYCKDHYKHYGAFPVEFATFNEDGSEKDVFTFPEYLEHLTDSQIRLIAYHKVEDK